MYKHDQETKRFLSKAKEILIKEMSNVEYILAEYKQYKGNNKECIAPYLAANIFAPGSEMLSYQIWKNLEEDFLLIALIGLRVLLENYINLHYIFHHPDHLKDDNWAEELCRDYLDRTIDSKARKSKLGKVSLNKRAKCVGLEEFYDKVYSELCNYSHFLANVTIDVVNPTYIKAKTIEIAIYDITYYQDILAAIATFFNFSLDNYTKEIFEYKKVGEQILASINKMIL